MRPALEDLTAADLPRLLIRVQEEERKRIGRDLHDGTGQALMLLRLRLELMAREKTADCTRQLQDALRAVDDAIDELRRVISGLSPRILNELGLVAAIRHEAEQIEKYTAISVKLDLPSEIAALPEEEAIALYRCVQEALQNAGKHAQARNVSIQLEQRGESVRLQIEDDGVGLSPKADARGRFGLRGMRERIASLGGAIQIKSRRGSGTSIEVEVQAQPQGELVRRIVPERRWPGASPQASL